MRCFGTNQNLSRARSPKWLEKRDLRQKCGFPQYVYRKRLRHDNHFETNDNHFGKTDQHFETNCKIPKMPDIFSKFQKCPAGSVKAKSWHMPERFIKITYGNDTCHHEWDPKRHKQTSINWMLFLVSFRRNVMVSTKHHLTTWTRPEEVEQPECYT